MNINLTNIDQHLSSLTSSDWNKLFNLLPEIEQTTNFGEMEDIQYLTPDVVFAPDFIEADIVIDFTTIAYDLGLCFSFDWQEWEEGIPIWNNRANENFNKLDPITLCKLITTIIRKDKYSEGTLVNLFKDGTVHRIIIALKNHYSKGLITDQETNKLYLADQLQIDHPEFFQRLIAILNAANINYELLDNAKDIWCRDYMPIQVKYNKFVKFTYHEDYSHLIPEDIKARTVFSSIVLDGGNVIKGGQGIIITDKVFKDNPKQTKEELITELQSLFETQNIYIIPHMPYDEFGHADGMVRGLMKRAVFVNDYSDTKHSPSFINSFDKAMEKHNLVPIKIPYKEVIRKNHENVDVAIGCYLNFLQMENLFIVPTFSELGETNEEVLKIYKQYFQPTPLDCTAIANEGGVLNCISWTVKE